MSPVKEILCLNHSHLDIGYTHPQPMLLELQCEYIDQAILLCSASKDYPEESQFKWTIEATIPLEKWWSAASEKERNTLRRLVREKRISIAALPAHTTPGCNILQMSHMVRDLDILREKTECSVNSAINHDVNGQPWPMSQILLDSHIDFYLTGINIHFGGIPFARPYIFMWETPDGRGLPTFLGEHYSLFSQFCFTYENDTKKMHQGIKEYVERVEKQGWTRDYVLLTATNPPLYDNNCPDANIADLVRRYNSEGHRWKVRFVTLETLREKVMQEDLNKLPVHRGDWSDYWNFGCASTARETSVSRRAKTILHKSEYLASLHGKETVREQKLKEQSYYNAIVYDEHTWGASQSVTHPDCMETYAQLTHKKDMAYTSADTAATLLARQMEKAAGNLAYQADKAAGIVAVNTGGTDARLRLYIPEMYFGPLRTLSALRAKQYLPYEQDKTWPTVYCGTISLPPYSRQKITMAQLKAMAEKVQTLNYGFEISKEKDSFTTPFYKVILNGYSGHILQIEHKESGKKLLDESSDWRFFECVRETVDPRRQREHRSSIFPRDVDLGNKNITQWNHDWHSLLQGSSEIISYDILQDDDSLTLSLASRMPGLDRLEQSITFYADSPQVSLRADFFKQETRTPESFYLVFPLKLKKNWECVYDTADSFVYLDAEHLGDSCRDWVSVDKIISMFDGENGVLLACPDAPMAQPGGFNFGKEQKSISRNENPLLLAWPMTNYWDTNFAASQSGKISLRYELTPMENFDAKEAYRLGLQAKQLADYGFVTDAFEAGQKAIQDLVLKNENVFPLVIRPAKCGNGIFAVLKNYGKTRENIELTFSGKTISEAMLCDLQENGLGKIPVENGRIQLEIDAQKLVYIKLMSESGI